MRWLRDQFALLRRHPIITALAALWAAISFYDTAGSQLLPPSWAQSRPSIYQVLSMTMGWLSLGAWLTIGCLICAVTAILYRHRMPWLLVAACAVFSAVLVIMDVSKRWSPSFAATDVYSAFASVSEVGLGTGGAIGSTRLFAYAEYENARVLWFLPDSRAIILGENKNPIFLRDIKNESEPRYQSDEFTRRITKTPRDKCPPLGGVASLWEQDRKKWDWMGYRVFQKLFHENKIFVQRFEHGMKIGPLPMGRVDRRGQIYVVPLNNEFNWFAKEIAVDAAGSDWTSREPCYG